MKNWGVHPNFSHKLLLSKKCPSDFLPNIDYQHHVKSLKNCQGLFLEIDKNQNLEFSLPLITIFGQIITNMVKKNLEDFLKIFWKKFFIEKYVPATFRNINCKHRESCRKIVGPVFKM